MYGWKLCTPGTLPPPEISKELTLQCRVLFIIRIAMSCELCVCAHWLVWSCVCQDASAHTYNHYICYVNYLRCYFASARVCVCVCVKRKPERLSVKSRMTKRNTAYSYVYVCNICVWRLSNMVQVYIRLSLENDCSNRNCL